MLAGSLGACRHDSTASDRSSPSAIGDWFTDEAEATGLDFVHVNGMTGGFYMPEIMGPGVALFDYDNDGDLDVYFVQGRTLGRETGTGVFSSARGEMGTGVFSSARGENTPVPISRGRLFRNDLMIAPDRARHLHFTDVTETSGIVATEYGMGAAAGDIDNDGWTDLYLTNFGRSQMFHNNGDGTFSDVSTASGTDGSGWAVSAAFLDYDRDGWLDLYVGNYLHYTVESDQKCLTPAGGRDYCAPQAYRAQPDRLYRNLGRGRFVDVTSTALIDPAFGPALGIATADFNNDGWIDIYVANDSQENQLWMNQHDGTFRNQALLAGVAVTADGQAEASMGVDAGDFDNDGDEDLFMAELTGEGSNLYVNNGSGRFTDRSAASRLGPITTALTGFGSAWLDVDNDGWLDLMSVNGMVRAPEERLNSPFPYAQRKRLFLSLRNGQFEDASERGGAVFQLSEVGRGAAFGDVDDDGDVDVVVANDAGRARLLVNHVGNRRHWAGLKLAGTQPLGARVEVVRRPGSALWRRARSDGSYASANDPRVLVGLGDSAEPITVRVRWPDGRTDEWSNVAVDRWTTLTAGERR